MNVSTHTCVWTTTVVKLRQSFSKRRESLRKETCQVSLIFVSVVAPSQSCFFTVVLWYSGFWLLLPCLLHKCFINALTPSPFLFKIFINNSLVWVWKHKCVCVCTRCVLISYHVDLGAADLTAVPLLAELSYWPPPPLLSFCCCYSLTFETASQHHPGWSQSHYTANSSWH